MSKRKTTEEVIADFRKVHGDRYDYSKVDYVNNKTKVLIICQEHGEFKQMPSMHKRGTGCPECGFAAKILKKTLTTQQVIEDFRKVHGDRYDYSKVNYVNSKMKVLIICQEHGEFWQRPTDHKKGNGCPECGTKRETLTTEEVIADFHEVHGDRYDYSKVDYVNSHTKVSISCPEHGEFSQTPNNHKQGHGCPRCGGCGRILTIQELIQDFKKVHGDRYDYSKVVYKRAHIKVTIICPEHGEFLQAPYSHKSGIGCPKCGYICGAKKQSLTTEQIIKDFREVHGDRYDYSKVVYVNDSTKVFIFCPEHGEFWQRAHDHKRGIGCPSCGKGQISEPLFRECLETIVSRFGDFKFPNIRPDWLRNPETDNRLELDCYNEELELAFELQGTQHYKPLKHWGGQKQFVKTIRRDNHKLTECRKHGVQLFRIDNRPVRYKTPQAKREYYENEIRKCLTKLPEDVKLKLMNANNKGGKHGTEEEDSEDST
jgi:protein-arginine kinase activator protein McsA